MDINKIYEELDALKYPEIEGYLRDKITEAKEKDVFEVYIPLLNELIGFFRDSTQFDKGRSIKEELMETLDHYGQQGTMNHATSLLNIANFDRAAGAYEDSLSEFGRCEEIYHKLLKKGDYLWAGLYNNKSLLYQEMGDHLAAIGALQDALYVVKEISEREIEVATTYVNIAQSFASLGQIEEAKTNIAEALKIFEKGGNTDYHYSGACAVCGAIAYAEEEYDKAAEWYDKAASIVRRIMGENDNVRLLESAASEARSMVKPDGDSNAGKAESGEAAGGSSEGVIGMSQSVKNEVNENGHKAAPNVDGEIKGLDICRSYYEQYGAPMIHEKYPEYEDKIAVGLFGEGSDCLGLDDEISRDHDWGPGFMMLVRSDIYDEIGQELQASYDELPRVYRGFERRITSEGSDRVGVVCIDELAYGILGRAMGYYEDEKYSGTDHGFVRYDPAKIKASADIASLIRIDRLDYIYETELAKFVNGEIWKDDTGVITAIRDRIGEYYTDTEWLRRLAVSLIHTGQTGQYNLPRMLGRDDRAGALMYLSDYMKNVLHTLFLINRTYAPYDKWLLKASGKLNIHPEIADIMTALADIYTEDMAGARAVSDEADKQDEKKDSDPYARITGTIEITAQIILQALKEIDVVDEDEDNWYLEAVGKKLFAGDYKVLQKNTAPVTDHTYDKEELVERIIKLEWEAFDKVQNEGGRADCQNNWPVFHIMRKSQYLEWNKPMLLSFIMDFEQANARGWNLITEKYGRMEKSTAPAEYEKIKDKLPPHTKEQDAIIEQIVSIQVGMMEEVAAKYPKLADNARILHTADDTEWNTSYETYLRGELGTYSERTLSLYGMFIVELGRSGVNLAYNIINNTAKLYGYDSIEKAEASL